MTYGPRPAGGPVPPLKLPEYHNTCTVCGAPCSCYGGITVKVIHENGVRHEATAIMCGDCADVVRISLPGIVTAVKGAKNGLPRIGA